MRLISYSVVLLIWMGTAGAGDQYVFHLRNGKRLVGQVVQESGDTIVIETRDGRVTLLREEVDSRAPYLVDRKRLDAAQEATIDQRYLEAIALFQEAYRDAKDSDLQDELQQRLEDVVDQWVRQSERRSGAELDWSDADRFSQVEGLIESAAVLERLKAEVWRIRDVRARYLVSEAEHLAENKEYEKAEGIYQDLRDHGYLYPRELAKVYLKHAVELMQPPVRDNGKALRLLLLAREADPDLFVTHLYLAYVYLELDSPDEAEKELRDASRYVAQFSSIEQQVFAQLAMRLRRAQRFPTFPPIPTVSPDEIAHPKRTREQEVRYWRNQLKWLYETGRWKEKILPYWYVPTGAFAALFLLWFLPWMYVKRDFPRRTLTGPNWSTFTFFTGIVGLLVYLPVRTLQEGRKVRCKRCGYNLSRLGDYTDYDYAHCPGCKAPIRPVFSLAQVIVSRARLLASGAAVSSVDTGSEEELFHLVCLHAFRSRAERADLRPDGKDLTMTFLIDGVRHPAFALPAVTGKPLLLSARKKANIDSSARFPQTGYFVSSFDDADVEVRLTVNTGDLGESLSLRLMDRRARVSDLAQIGLDEHQQGTIRDELEKPLGLIAVTGSPGMGKTTLAYAMLRHLNDGQHYLATLENPIQLELPGVTQIDEGRSGLKGKAALEAILRQNVDVLFVEEVRDRESVEFLIRASSTNLRTIICLDSPDAVTALERFLANNLQPELVAGGLSMIIAVRLVRKLCSTCKMEAKLRRRDIERLDLPAEQMESARLFIRKGCDKCSGTGYRGRTGVFEILPMTNALREAILSSRSREEIASMASSACIGGLKAHATRKALAGVTDLEEVARVVSGAPG
jgi:type II secretory ATPase GspE/PulE/Tfp pilus assembly ATPase PilB-like protein/tetratricopeptide (TPR) repeat protein